MATPSQSIGPASRWRRREPASPGAAARAAHIRRIRRRVAAATATLFAVVWLVVFYTLVLGNDPALTANAQRRAAAAKASVATASGSAGTSGGSSSAGTGSGSSGSSSSGSSSNGYGYYGSGSGSSGDGGSSTQSSGGLAPVTTGQS